MFPLKNCLEMTELWLEATGVWFTTKGASPSALLNYEGKELQNFHGMAIKSMLFLYGGGDRLNRQARFLPGEWGE